MKRLLIPLAFVFFVTACSTNAPIKQTLRENETLIYLTDEKIYVQNEAIQNEGDVYLANDIIYYEDRDTYDSGMPYGEGSKQDRHSEEEAKEHQVIHITKPGVYRIQGTLSKGQIFIDLGDEAKKDETAIVELILDNVDITCTVAPAIFFYNVYEADQNAVAYLEEENEDYVASSNPNLENAGANVYLEENSINTIKGSYVARIYEDKEGEEKLHKYDGAFYSRMSMNIDGPGSLNIIAENEGLDSECHLSIHDGIISIQSNNDGINTNEDHISVTSIHGGQLKIVAGLGEEGDGIDSNGYLVINGGTIITSANSQADAGMDADLGILVNGGTIVALGSDMQTQINEGKQATLSIQFKESKEASEKIVITDENDQAIFAFDASIINTPHSFKAALLSFPALNLNENYKLYIANELSGEEVFGIYQGNNIAYADATLQTYQLMMQGFKPNGKEGFKSNDIPEDFDPEKALAFHEEMGEPPLMNHEDFKPDVEMPHGNNFNQGELFQSFTLNQLNTTLTNISRAIESQK